MTPFKLSLQKPVFNNLGQKVEEITLQRPSGAEILECGFPYVQTRHARTNEVREEVNTTAMLQLIARCASVPFAAMSTMDAVDIYQCVETMRFFFHYRIQKPSSGTTSKPDDGAETAPSSSD